MSGRDALEMGQVFRQAPGQAVVDTDAAIAIGGDDDGERHVDSAMQEKGLRILPRGWCFRGRRKMRR